MAVRAREVFHGVGEMVFWATQDAVVANASGVEMRGLDRVCSVDVAFREVGNCFPMLLPKRT